ncbi:MAG TPA: HRDC domain-containing protein [Blastocatellia bacterium]|nr:HRDC domain-containing protein [Blastocatellia bacterium]
MAWSISYQYVIDPDDARAALEAFADQTVIGLDTETYWDYGERLNRLSLLQLAAPTGEVIVIDALTAGIIEARALIENPSVMMAAHNARFDEGVLRGAGFEVAGLVDTLRLSRRTLRLRSFSLAAVSEHLFGMQMDKTYQQSDWKRRPLSRAQLDYAALDARIALRVYQELSAKLEESGQLEEELSRAKIGLPGIEAEGFNRANLKSKRRPVELRPLTADERQLLERLKRWRKRTAEQERIPAYLVCHDRTLEHLAIVRPDKVEDLADIFGLGAARIAKYGTELLNQIQVDAD